MTDYWGRIDLDNMPPQNMIRRWNWEARQIKESPDGRDLERVRMDYSWTKIMEYQNESKK